MTINNTINSDNFDFDDRQLVGYLGNKLLKKSGEVINWTPEMIQEFEKCSNDPIYMCRNYLKISHIDRGLINLDLYDYQEDIIKSSLDNRYTIITAARQSGKTTGIIGFILPYVIFNSRKRVAILANKEDTAKKILGRIKLAYQHLPKWLQQGVVTWNKKEIELENGSSVLAAATSSDNVRGDSFSCIFLDEVAFIEGWEEFSSSVLPTITSGKTSKIIMVSTPKGLNHYYDLWKGANKGKNDYNPILVNWWDVPGRDEEWKRSTLSMLNNDQDKFEQEYENRFMGSSGTLINGRVLENMDGMQPLKANVEDNIKIYEPVHKDHIYAITVDVSRGKGLDYSAFSVIDVSTMPYKQVCTFRDNSINPFDYAGVVNEIGKIYNEAYILVETNDIGAQVAHNLHEDFEYDNLIRTESAGRKGKKVSTGFSGNKSEIGITTSVSVKAKGCSMLKILVEQEKLEINDIQTLHELKRFSKKGASYEAEEGSHDDMVMGLVLFAWLSLDPYFHDMADTNSLALFREKTDKEIYDMLPIGFINDGTEEPGAFDLELRPGEELVEGYSY